VYIVYTQYHASNRLSRAGIKQDTRLLSGCLAVGKAPYVRVVLFVAEGSRLAVPLRALQCVGREELVDGEMDPGEELAGILLVGSDALLIRHAVVVGRDKQLRVALQLDDGELAEGDKDAAAGEVDEQLAGEALGNEAGDLENAGIALVVVADIDELHPEDDGIDGFDNGHGEICRFDGVVIKLAQGGRRGENLGAAFAAKEDDALVENGKPGDFVGPVDK
jgi:hypothetical protein